MNIDTNKVLTIAKDRKELVERRKNKSPKNLHDRMQEYYEDFYEDDEFYALVNGITGNDDTVEGSVSADLYTAVRMIREKSRENKDHIIGNKKLATLVKSLKVVMRRYE